MKNFIVLIFILTLIGCSSTRKIKNKDVTGMWEFPGTMVWIEIKPNNFVYQCRVDKNGSIYNAVGILKKGIIYWEKRWGKDTIIMKNDTMRLNGLYGNYGYIRSSNKMAKKCLSPIN
ncbi:hypothetical protein BFR04_05375 [Gaetbulibacter sp. 4G1]|nr:hypothetical protein [Gaetbulibacter sp. 4G1]PIA78953.1 hypothetical protein BFR04_05375 [Gaetbulibacter sp. 4G1]